MSKAIRCDRCFICFDPYSEKDNWASLKEITIHNDAVVRTNTVVHRTGPIDLCPDCSKEFLSWFYVDDNHEPEECEDWKTETEALNT